MSEARPRLRLIVLDFDGVIAESNGEKDRAFEELFGEYPQHRDAMLDFHEEHSSSPRAMKFRHYAAHLMGRPDDEALIGAMGDRFSELVVDRVVGTDLVPGAREFLDLWSSRLPLYVASVTPQDELRTIVRRKGLDRYFAGVFGNPPFEKADAIREAMATEGVPADETVLIGDALSDHSAAIAAGTHFLGRVSETGFGDLNVTAVPDLFAVHDILDSWAWNPK